MTPAFYDSETYPIKPGLQFPPVVLTQWARPDSAALVPWRLGLDLLREHLEAGGHLAGHAIAFDMGAAIATRPDLAPLIFQAYLEDRIACTVAREKLLRIAQGTAWRYKKHNLPEVLNRYKIPHLFQDGDKAKDGSSVRTKYEQWKDLADPYQMPPEAVRYAVEDVAHGHQLLAAQDALDGGRGWLEDQYRQARADFLLKLISAHGFRVDQAYVEAFRQEVEEEAVRLRDRLKPTGLVRHDNSRDMKKARARMYAACRAAQLPVPLTDTGVERLKKEEITQEQAEREYTALDKDACKASQDPILIDFARFGSVKTLRSRAHRLRLAGDLPIQTSFDALKDTGRTSSRAGKVKPGRKVLAWGDQTQNMHREAGLRECYRARPGHLLVSVDWSAAELSTLAESCVRLGLGSRLGEIIRSGKDPHLSFGAAMYGWEYEWALANKKTVELVKEARQAAKAANFGFPGGLGVTTFRIWAAVTYDVHLSEEEARRLRGAWFSWYPEMRGYFAHVNALIESGQPLVQFLSGRRRGGVYYTNACNSYFQGLAADMAKDAGFLLALACYVDRSSPLYGCRIVNFVHDEYILEVPIARAHECAMAVVEIMEDAGRRWAPSAPPAAEPALSYRWRKAAEPTYREGLLVPYEDRDIETETVKWPEPGNPDLRIPLVEAIQRKTREGIHPIHLSWAYGLEVDRIRRLAA